MVFGFHHAASAIHTESRLELACDLTCDFSVVDEKWYLLISFVIIKKSRCTVMKFYRILL